MKHWFFWVALGVDLGACGGSPRAAGPAPVVASTAPPVPSCPATADHVLTLVNKADDRSRRMRDVIETRCTTDAWPPDARACIARTQSLADPQHCKQKLSADQRRALEVGLAAVEHEPEVAGSYDPTKVPAECLQYLRAIQAFESCEKVPQASRDAMKQGAEVMVDTFSHLSTMPPDARAAMADACKQGADAVAQSAAGMGC